MNIDLTRSVIFDHNNPSSTRHCVVTGAAGFIGSHLCHALLLKGYIVHGIDMFFPNYCRRLKEKNLSHLLSYNNFSFYEFDIRTADLRNILRGASTIYHLAALPGLSSSNTDHYYDVNVKTTGRLLDQAISSDVAHFIFSSSSSVYGDQGLCHEDSHLGPKSPYGYSKLAGENLCLRYASNNDLIVTIVRLFSVYGPRQRPDMAYNIFINSALHAQPVSIFGDGKQIRSNTYISDCVNGLMLISANVEDVNGEIFNLAGAETIILLDALSYISNAVGIDIPYNFQSNIKGDFKYNIACIDKIMECCKYRPQIDFKTGINNQIAWQIENSNSQS